MYVHEILCPSLINLPCTIIIIIILKKIRWGGVGGVIEISKFLFTYSRTLS